MVDASKRAISKEAYLSNSNVMLPFPFRDFDRIFFTPVIRASIASNFEVTSISTIRAELSRIVKSIVRLAYVREGNNLTGNDGMTASPTNDTATKATMIVKDDMVVFFSNINP